MPRNSNRCSEPATPAHGHRKSGRYTVRSMLQIERVTSERDRRVVRRLFGEYQRGVTELLNGTDICP